FPYTPLFRSPVRHRRDHPRPRHHHPLGRHRAGRAAAARLGDRRAIWRALRPEDEARIAAHDPRHRRARRRLPHGAAARLAARGDLHGADAGGLGPWRGLLLAVLAPLALGQAPPAAEPRLVPDVSQRQVEIRYSFSGAELLLFGAILYPGGRTPDAVPDVAVVLKGPLQRIVLREKQKVAGIWMNVERVRFRSAPSFYAVASSRPPHRNR